MYLITIFFRILKYLDLAFPEEATQEKAEINFIFDYVWGKDYSFNWFL